MIHNGHATSIEAADSIKPTAATMRAKVLACILSGGARGKTRDEITAETGLQGNTVRPRVAELMQAGLVELSDQVRRNASGRRCEVLIANARATVIS